MATSRIEPQRIQPLNDQPLNARGEYVLYWMQASCRAEHNPALELAVQRANAAGKRLLVAFGLMDGYPEANLRHYTFLVQGLADVASSLKRRGIKFVVQRGSPDQVALRLAKRAVEVVADRGYLRFQKAWRRRVAGEAKVRVTQVECDAVVPVQEVSDKPQWAARTLRPRINAQRDKYLVELRTTPLDKHALNLSIRGENLDAADKLLASMKLDRSVPPVDWLFTGGGRAARGVLHRFLRAPMGRYEQNRNQPQTDDVSYMSMYLHFGMISPVALALAIRDTPAGSAGDRETYLEELIVRRELALNFCEFREDYDSYDALPRWALTTLQEHADDPRQPLYTPEQLEDVRTHDPYWNAAMREMRDTGFMHNYMRMYWGKKILEWSPSPREAFGLTLALNNKYFLDGRDPNSYANVGWVFGLHDRAWTRRPVFGKVRYMNANGLNRKCDPEAYVRKVNQLARRAREARG